MMKPYSTSQSIYSTAIQITQWQAMPQSGSQEPLCGNALGRSPKEVTHNWRTSDAQGHANFPSVNVILFKLVYTAVEVPENVYIYVGSYLTGFNPKHVHTTTRAVSRWSSMRPLYQFMFSHHSGSWVDTLRSFLWDGSQHNHNPDMLGVFGESKLLMVPNSAF